MIRWEGVSRGNKSGGSIGYVLDKTIEEAAQILLEAGWHDTTLTVGGKLVGRIERSKITGKTEWLPVDPDAAPEAPKPRQRRKR